MTEQLRYSNSSSPRHHPQSRKVKLLCSRGGKILPRPTDGQLRYIGGHTRIVSVPKTVTFEDLMAKMSEVNGGGTVAMKYQLPDEDLDALISVSCGEDLENMLEEYERIIANDPAGKIRVFLFGADGGSDGNAVAVTDLNDTGQRYFEAVNGISNDSSGSSIGSLKRKDSGLSAGSSNSGIEAAENFGNNTVIPPQTLNHANQVYLDPNLLQFTHAPANLVTLTANPTQTNGLKSTESYTRTFQPSSSQFPPLTPVFAHSQQVEALDDCYMCQKMLPHAHSDTIAQNIGNGSSTTRSEISPVFYSQHSEDTTRNLIPQTQNLGVNLVDVGKQPLIHNMQTIDHSTSFVPPPEAQPSYGLFMGNFPRGQSAIPSQIPINLQVIAKPLGSDFLPVSNTETYNRTINGMMEGVHLNPTNAHVMPETSHTVVDNAHVYMPQIGGNVTYHTSQFIRPMDQMPLSTTDINHMQNYTTMVENQGPFPPHMEPPMPSEGLLGMPTYTYNGNRVMNNEPPQLELHDLLSGSDTFGLSSAMNAAAAAAATKQLDAFPECSHVDSFFSNQDPRKIVGGMHQLPPKPKRIASNELIAPKDSGVQVHLGNSTESDIIALLEEGGLHRSSDGPNKQVRDFIASEDEQIKQDLQAVAEGVASSVLNSSSPKGPVFIACDSKEINNDNVSETMLIYADRKLEDNKSKAGFQITEDIGRLQIIKNSDLEELRELGSGTFGTVYHGKWRGSDVAIKRINDRCFVGKPSEQEKMRTDFWNEACKLADLHHPNVVAFYGVVLDGPGGSVATVTEYMVNGSLRNALQKNDKILDKRKRLLIAMDVAFGMEYLHGKNIVHFDLKSDNLLVNLRDPQRPICKVGDLGLSKVKCQTLISGGVRGTLPWMAPELLNGSSSLVSEKVDVFSFGIVMWELITGEEPYADLHYGAIIGGIVSNTLRPPIPEKCDLEWRALMEKCWSADPSERPSFTEIAETLRIMASSLPQKHRKRLKKVFVIYMCVGWWGLVGFDTVLAGSLLYV